jgi:hypothetical protein
MKNASHLDLHIFENYFDMMRYLFQNKEQNLFIPVPMVPLSLMSSINNSFASAIMELKAMKLGKLRRR